MNIFLTLVISSFLILNCKQQEKQVDDSETTQVVESNSDNSADVQQDDIEPIETSDVSSSNPQSKEDAVEEKVMTAAEQHCQDVKSLAISGGSTISCGDNVNEHQEFLSMAGMYIRGPEPAFFRMNSATAIGDRMLLGAGHSCAFLKDNDRMADARFVFGDKISTNNKFESNIIDCEIAPLDGSTRMATGIRDNDMAIFYLMDPFPPQVKTVKVLPPELAADITQGTELKLVGYGLDGSVDDVKANSHQLNTVNVKLDLVYEEAYSYIYRSPTGKGHSNGDSGGPAFINVNGENYIAGLITGYLSWDELFSSYVQAINAIRAQRETLVFRETELVPLLDEDVMAIFSFEEISKDDSSFPAMHAIWSELDLLITTQLLQAPDYAAPIPGEEALLQEVFAIFEAGNGTDKVFNREMKTIGLGVDHILSRIAESYDWIQEKIQQGAP